MPFLPFEQEKRTLLVKRELDSDFRALPEKSIQQLLDYGIVVLNKPKGPSSHQCSDFVQKILGIKKAGHGGTLDPAVTGVLPVALGKATRIVQALLPAGKEYVGIMHIHKELSPEQISKACAAFVGRITQMVPRKSAVKRQERERTVYYFEILEIKDKDVLFVTGVEAGTYIRKLCSDIGRHLGTGAHMAELIRTKAGPFKYEDSVTLQELQDAIWYYENEKNEKPLRNCLKPIEYACQHLPKVWVLDSTINSLCHGAPLHLPGIAKIETGIETEKTVALMTLSGEFIGLGRAVLTSDQILLEQKGLAVKPFKIFMEPFVGAQK